MNTIYFKSSSLMNRKTHMRVSYVVLSDTIRKKVIRRNEYNYVISITLCIWSDMKQGHQPKFVTHKFVTQKREWIGLCVNNNTMF